MTNYTSAAAATSAASTPTPITDDDAVADAAETALNTARYAATVADRVYAANPCPTTWANFITASALYLDAFEHYVGTAL